MRVALGVEYDGYGFHGWQTQENLPTIQGCLETALTRIADEPVKLFCAGRTDAGVHATNQVIHFDTSAVRSHYAWVAGTNSHLPLSIVVHWAQVVDDGFHARFSALARSYRYIIYNCAIHSALLATRVTWHYYPLDVGSMQLAAQALLGEHDFSSFRSSQCDSKTPMRNIRALTVKRQGDFVLINITANAFLHHMVRNIVGTLLLVGEGRRTPAWVQEVLLAKDRKKAGKTAGAPGLYLSKIDYPDQYAIPVTDISLFTENN